METKIIKEDIQPYWEDETKLIKEQTVVSNYSKDGFDIELKKEIGWFIDRPNDVMVYRTYVKIFKEGKMLKRRLWYVEIIFIQIKGYDKQRTIPQRNDQSNFSSLFR